MMTPQVQAFWVFVIVGGLVAAFFLWVAFSTRHMHDVDMKTAYRLGGLKLAQPKRLKELERENTKLKGLVAEL
jgi:hypothetical protein